MEDISRELEREIERAKPTPYKTSRKKKVLVVDDFGEMKSGTYLSVLVRFFGAMSLVFGVAAIALYVLYGRLSVEHAQIQQELVRWEGRAKQLIDEKEILMARLVMAGEKPILPDTDSSKAVAGGSKDKASGKVEEKSASKPLEKPPEPKGEQHATAAPDEKMITADRVDEAEEPSAEASELSNQGESVQQRPTGPGQTQSRAEGGSLAGSDLVRVEKFSLSKIPDREDLRVKFNIRNIKKGPGEISGRIFLVLKTASNTSNDWIVVPKAPIENGIPADYKRGQYFSISRFKPVRFTISSPSNFKELAMAAIYIFNDDGQIMYKDELEVAVGEEN